MGMASFRPAQPVPTTPKRWGKVVEYSNWCWIDCLDGNRDEPITDGLYSVRWPDGTEMIETVIVTKETETVNDMGHEYNAPKHKAFAVILSRGKQANVPLEGLMVKKV